MVAVELWILESQLGKWAGDGTGAGIRFAHRHLANLRRGGGVGSHERGHEVRRTTATAACFHSNPGLVAQLVGHGSWFSARYGTAGKEDWRERSVADA